MRLRLVCAMLAMLPAAACNSAPRSASNAAGAAPSGGAATSAMPPDEQKGPQNRFIVCPDDPRCPKH